MYRLGHVRDTLEGLEGHAVILVGEGACRDDWRTTKHIIGADGPDDIDPMRRAQIAIDDHKIRGLATGQSDSFWAVRGRNHTIPVIAKNLCEQLAMQRVVFDNEYREHRCPASSNFLFSMRTTIQFTMYSLRFVVTTITNFRSARMRNDLGNVANQLIRLGFF
jgi:hypothetical protein